MELSEFDVRYKPREVIKAEVLAYFIAKFSPTSNQMESREQNSGSFMLMARPHNMQEELGLFYRHQKETIWSMLSVYSFKKPIMKAEYETLLQGIELAKSLEAKSILIQGGSQLVISQVNGTCEAREERMKKSL